MNFKGGGHDQRSRERWRPVSHWLVQQQAREDSGTQLRVRWVCTSPGFHLQHKKRGWGKCQGYWGKLTAPTAALRQPASLRSCVHTALLGSTQTWNLLYLPKETYVCLWTNDPLPQTWMLLGKGELKKRTDISSAWSLWFPVGKNWNIKNIINYKRNMSF